MNSPYLMTSMPRVKHISASEPLLNFKFSEPPADTPSQAPPTMLVNNPRPNTPLNQLLSNRVALLEQANLWLQQNSFLKAGHIFARLFETIPTRHGLFIVRSKIEGGNHFVK